MNGRIYDPLVGRFLSVDNYVQDPTNTQHYNRYSYCLNNPLKYSDPSGWLFHKAEEYDPIAAADAQFASEWSGFILGRVHGGGGVLPGWANGVYHYNYSIGEYTNDDGDIVPFSEVKKKYIDPRMNPATKTTYAIFQSGGKDENGKFVGSGSFGVIKEGIMISDGTYSTFTSYEGASNYINSVSGWYLFNAWDLNGDGKFQKNEADFWWLKGKGDVWVDNAKINWSGLKIPKEASQGSIFGIKTTQAFLSLPFETAATYGGTSFKVMGSSQVMVLDQSYHYEYRPNNSIENIVRNIMNWYGKPEGQGTDFNIHYYNSIILAK